MTTRLGSPGKVMPWGALTSHLDGVHDDLLGVIDAGVPELGADIVGRPEAGHAHQGPALGLGGGG